SLWQTVGRSVVFYLSGVRFNAIYSTAVTNVHAPEVVFYELANAVSCQSFVAVVPHDIQSFGIWSVNTPHASSSTRQPKSAGMIEVERGQPPADAEFIASY